VPETLLALGGNIGDVRTTLDRAEAMLCENGGLRLVARSSDYRTPAWGVTDQPPFLNRCLLAETNLAPLALLDRAQAVERALGRDRSREQRWGPRTVDIDILSYDDLVLDLQRLTLPHPRLFERAFVLVPLAEIAGDRLIAGRRVRDALAGLDTAGIERLASPGMTARPGRGNLPP
jgi:2-amino-4-hydroxy-6-hydroxymethyldihydropteridine diphosphokinase